MSLFLRWIPNLESNVLGTPVTYIWGPLCGTTVIEWATAMLLFTNLGSVNYSQILNIDLT